MVKPITEGNLGLARVRASDLASAYIDGRQRHGARFPGTAARGHRCDRRAGRLTCGRVITVDGLAFAAAAGQPAAAGRQRQRLRSMASSNFHGARAKRAGTPRKSTMAGLCRTMGRGYVSGERARRARQRGGGGTDATRGQHATAAAAAEACGTAARRRRLGIEARQLHAAAPHRGDIAGRRRRSSWAAEAARHDNDGRHARPG